MSALRAAAIVAPALAFTTRNLLVPVERIVGRVPDDALFYLVLARNLRAGRGLTFDGVDPTTGFHPLWLAIVAMGPTSPEAGFRWLLGLHGVVTVVSVMVLDAVLRRAGVRSLSAALVSASAGVWGVTAYGLGMETALVALLALLSVGVGVPASWGGGAGPPRNAPPRSVGGVVAFGVGVLLGLARVDAVPLLLGAGRRAGVALLGGIVGIAGVLAFNLAVTGERASTSARLKGMGTVAERVARLDAEVVWRHVPGPMVAAVVVGAAAWVLGRRPRAPVPAGPLLAALGGVMWIGASYLGNNLVGPWYFAAPTWGFVVAATVLASRARFGGVLVAVLVGACLRGAGLPGEGLHATVVGAARAVRDATTADARIVVEDFPGMFAWFSERTVFPADGLAAGAGYRDALVEGRAMAWWSERGATHWMVTRRRAAWLSERPLVDRIAPPFLPVPATPVPLDPDAVVVMRVDAGGRVFALYGMDVAGR